MSFTTTVRCETELYTLVARVTLFPNPRGCIPDPPDVRWEKVILGHGEVVDASDPDLTIDFDRYDEWAVELAQSDLEDLEAFDRCCG